MDDASVLAIGHTIRRDKGMNQCLVGLGKFPEQTGTVTQPAFVFGLDTVCVHAEFHLAQVYDPVSPLYYHVYLSAGHSFLLIGLDLPCGQGCSHAPYSQSRLDLFMMSHADKLETATHPVEYISGIKMIAPPFIIV